MSIVRGPKPADRYTIIRNELIENEELSVQARLLMIYLLSKPDTWQVNPAQLATIADASRIPFKERAVYAALNELIDAGYIRRQVVRGERGIVGHRYTVYDCPQVEQSTRVDDPKKPATKKNAPVTFDEFCKACEDAGEQKVPADDPVFEDMRTAGIPSSYLVLHWAWFRQWAVELDASGKERRYAGIRGWRQVFRKSMRGGWSKLWWKDSKSGQWCLTQAGIMMQSSLNKGG